MLLVLSPAKTLDFNYSWSTPPLTKPSFWEDTLELVKSLNSMTKTEIANLFKVSDSLAQLNFQRYQDFSTSSFDRNSQPAITAFRGDVYKAFDRENLTEQDYNFAQKHIRILSGLYGILKPLDRIQPYRLEMGTKLANSRGRNLYNYWQEKVTMHLNQALQEEDRPILLNLASKEYMSVISTQKLNFPIVTIIFQEKRNNKLKVIPIQAKRARGIMANWIIKNRVDSLDELIKFSQDKYKYDSSVSSESEYIFTR